jgi:hypothetical protein
MDAIEEECPFRRLIFCSADLELFELQGFVQMGRSGVHSISPLKGQRRLHLKGCIHPPYPYLQPLRRLGRACHTAPSFYPLFTRPFMYIEEGIHYYINWVLP